MATPNLPYIEATVKHLEQVTGETAAEVKELGKIMARMEGTILALGKQNERLHAMMDSLMSRTASQADVKEAHDRIDHVEGEVHALKDKPAQEALDRERKIREQLMSIAVGIIGLAGIGALIYAIAENIIKNAAN